MLKNKIFVYFMVFAMVAMYGFVPMAEAASLTNAKDAISNSNTSATNVTHTIQFTTGQALVATDYEEVVIPSGFGNVLVGNVTCPDAASTTASVSGAGPYTVKCTVNGGETIATGAKTLVITGVTNPGTPGSQMINLATRDSGNVEKEGADVMVAIISSVTVSATVPTTLTFGITGLATSTTINGETTTGSSTATSLAFNTLSSSASSSLGQQLTVVTNAAGGYVVTVKQNNELTNGAGSNINSFDNSPNNTGSTTPHAWNAPAGTLDSQHTYGHMGLTTDDDSLSGGNLFGGAKFAGLNGSSVMEIMYHNGPADGTTQSKGMAKIAYKIQISDLQEAGDYNNTLTYICTPTY